jgi:DNA-binding GntR family transcriptional regulator
VRAVDKAYAAVKEGIFAGRFPPGTRITEYEVVSASGVSRTPAREALRRLHSEGLVDMTPNQGAVVIDWSPADTDEIFDLRAALESYGAARAAARATPEQIRDLEVLATRQQAEARERRDGHLERIASLNSQFHNQLQHASASPRLSRILAALLDASLIMKTFSHYTADDLERSAAHHLELVQALAKRDAEWAASVMRSHVLAAKRSLRRR